METPESGRPTTDGLPKIEDGMSAEDWYKVLAELVEKQNRYAKESMKALGESDGADAAIVFYLGAIYVRLGDLMKLFGKQFSLK